MKTFNSGEILKALDLNSNFQEVTSDFNDVHEAIDLLNGGITNLNFYVENTVVPSIEDNKTDITNLQTKIEDIESSKDLGVVVVGKPSIHGSLVSGFTKDSYLMMPRIIEFGSNTWQLDFLFTTGQNVTDQQNIIDSAYGLALAVSGGHIVIALSSNGTSWNLGAHTGTYQIKANTSYYARMTFDGSKYVVAISEDRKQYVNDITYASLESLKPVLIYIGKSPDGTHTFTGSVYLYYAVLTINNEVVWTGTLGGELKDQVKDIEDKLNGITAEDGDVLTKIGNNTTWSRVTPQLIIYEDTSFIIDDAILESQHAWFVWCINPLEELYINPTAGLSPHEVTVKFTAGEDMSFAVEDCQIIGELPEIEPGLTYIVSILGAVLVMSKIDDYAN